MTVAVFENRLAENFHGVGKFTVENVAAMTYKTRLTLHCRHLQTRFTAKIFVAEFVDVVDFVERQQIFKLNGCENILSLRNE